MYKYVYNYYVVGDVHVLFAGLSSTGQQRRLDVFQSDRCLQAESLGLRNPTAGEHNSAQPNISQHESYPTHAGLYRINNN